LIVALGVGLAGAAGTLSRYGLDAAIKRVAGSAWPWGTTLVNLIGSYFLGAVAGSVIFRGTSPVIETVLGTGFCGGFTTWSAVSWEAVRLLDQDRFGASMAVSLGGIGVSLLAVSAGLAVAALL
jgi:CrcB protein